MLMGRKVRHVVVFRPVNLGVRRMGDGAVEFLAEASRPGRLVAATASPGRHETPGTDLGRAERPRTTSSVGRAELPLHLVAVELGIAEEVAAAGAEGAQLGGVVVEAGELGRCFGVVQAGHGRVA